MAGKPDMDSVDSLKMNVCRSCRIVSYVGLPLQISLVPPCSDKLQLNKDRFYKNRGILARSCHPDRRKPYGVRSWGHQKFRRTTLKSSLILRPSEFHILIASFCPQDYGVDLSHLPRPCPSVSQFDCFFVPPRLDRRRSSDHYPCPPTLKLPALSLDVD
jgi:hypothetical protein